ncbi:MAG TPA: DUF3562 domain-containing protein [Steroidobacteraceae bacterium]|nr:DUF3562 domain-containing protein [Steroidobacteraceae bacterium]
MNDPLSIPNMPGLDVDPRVVESLASHYGLPVGDVEVILREELDDLAANARIGTFVMVLATSRARARLQAGTR